MGQKEVDRLRALIRTRAALLSKIKTAKGRRLSKLQADLSLVQSDIRKLDEKQN